GPLAATAMFCHRIARMRREARSNNLSAGMPAGHASNSRVLALYRGNDARKPEEFLGILRFAVNQHLVMHVRAGGPAGAAEKSDLAVPRDPLADRDGLAMKMRIAGGDAVAVIDFDDLAVIVAIPGIGH